MTQQQQFTITELTANTIDAGNRMRLASWLDTYVNDELGITREWIQERNKNQMSDDIRAKRLERLSDPNCAGWVALDADDNVSNSPRGAEGGRCNSPAVLKLWQCNTARRELLRVYKLRLDNRVFVILDE